MFSKAVWRLTEIDGQLGIADINISNFLFTRSSMSDDTVENLLEMGYVNVKNLLPNQLYTDCLSPTELRYVLTNQNTGVTTVFYQGHAIGQTADSEGILQGETKGWRDQCQRPF